MQTYRFSVLIHWVSAKSATVYLTSASDIEAGDGSNKLKDLTPECQVFNGWRTAYHQPETIQKRKARRTWLWKGYSANKSISDGKKDGMRCRTTDAKRQACQIPGRLSRSGGWIQRHVWLVTKKMRRSIARQPQ